jgi:hypothetical protein
LELQNTAGVTVAGVDASGNGVGGLAHPPMFKNLIINGDMQVAQRGTSVTGSTSNGFKTVDRFAYIIGTQGTWTHTVENDAPTGSGFRKSAKTLCTTADASPGTSDILLLVQPIEGQNLQAIRKGTANAQQLTLSFWVKANVTGTYIAELEDSDNTRTVSLSYTINSSATWEKKTIVFPADTTGVLDNDNAGSLTLVFWLGGGSTWTSGTLNTNWNTQVNANRAVGQVNLAAATNNYWQITGVQLEVGSTATEFEFLPAQTELALCQRYYWRAGGASVYQYYGIGSSANTTNAGIIINNPVPMRATPTSIDFSTVGVTDGVTLTAATNVTADILSPIVSSVLVTVASGLTQFRPYRFLSNNSASAYFGLSAEL